MGDQIKQALSKETRILAFNGRGIYISTPNKIS